MNKIAVLGGSGISTPVFVEALYNLLGTGAHVTLVGRDTDKVQVVAKMCNALVPDLHTTWTDSIEAGVEGASIILNQIRVGGLTGRAWDEKAPSRLGLIGEESIGAGGFSLAYRTLPVIREIGAIVERVAPDAWFVNLTNPAGLVVSTLASETNVRAISLCDMPVAMLKQVNSLSPRPIKGYRVFGTNHASWLTHAWDEHGQSVVSDVIHALSPASCPIDHALIEMISAIPNPYLRYLFHPERYAPTAPINRSRGDDLLEVQEELLNAYRTLDVPRALQLLSGRNPHWYEEIVVPVMGALVDQRYQDTFAIQVPNRGLVPFLRDTAAIEVMAEVTPRGYAPLPVDNIPSEVMTQTLQLTEYDELVRQASRSKEETAAIRALMLNPMVGSLSKAREFWRLLSQQWLTR